MKIVISPFSNLKAMSDGKPHPKNPPHSFWFSVVNALKLKHEIIQVGVDGEDYLINNFKFNLKIPELVDLIKDMDLFISVDNFFPHFCHHYNKRGIVIFAQSDYSIFGYSENINLLKHKKYLRDKQFWLWSQTPYIEEAFVNPSVVLKAVEEFQNATVAPALSLK